MKILIVDDDEVDRQAIRRSLATPAGAFETVEAGSGEIALDLLQREAFDCMLLDQRLPDEDGLGVLTEIRTNRDVGALAIVVLTGRGDERLAVRVMQEGAQDYLTKEDLNPVTLPRVIRTAVERARLAEERRRANAELEAAYGRLTTVNQALLESERRFRVAFETAPAGMIIFATDGRILQANRAYCDMLGFSEQELLSRSLDAVRHPEDLEHDRSVAAQMLGGEVGTYQEERRLRRKGGEEIWTLVSTSLMRNDTGQPLHFISQALDLTEIRKAQEQLGRAQRLDALGQLTGGVAHDFNNLLMALQLNIELIQSLSNNSDDLKELADTSLRAVQRGAELTRQLLSFARRQILQPKSVAINDLLQSFLGLLRRTLGEHVSIETAFAEDCWITEVDPGQFETALLNLALNARDAMPGGGTLLIETENTILDNAYAARNEEVVPGEYVMIAVSDTGTGMPPSVIEKAFEPFFTTKDVGEGTGLGLSMVYGFVKQSRGHVRIYSEEGEGTTVKLYLPRAKSGAVASVEEEQADGMTLPGQERVLVVEDDPDVRVTIRSLLASIGYDVRAVTDGPDALALLDSGDFQPDLALLDVILPRGMNGREVSEAIAERVPSCKMLFMSGYTKNVVVHQGRIYDDIVLLSKPFPRSELAARIREVLDDEVTAEQ